MTQELSTKIKSTAQLIQVNDPSTLVSYGSEIANKISSNSDELLKISRFNSSSKVLDIISKLKCELDEVDLNRLNHGWSNLPIIRWFSKSIHKILVKYDSAIDNITSIQNDLLKSIEDAKSDNKTLQSMYTSNLEYIDNLEVLIEGAKLKLSEVDSQLEVTVDPTGHELSNLRNFRFNLDKKIADLESLRFILTQDLFRIKSTEQSNYMLMDKSMNVITNVIPLWKNQLTLALMHDNQRSIIEAHKIIDSTTEDIIKYNADSNKNNTIDTLKASSSLIINPETMKYSMDKLMETIAEVKRIQIESTKLTSKVGSEIRAANTELLKSISDKSLK